MEESEAASVPAKRLTAIVAMTPSGVIGRDGQLPWRLSTDLRRFKQITMGGVLIMGRRTYDSIGRPLPGRKTIVITRNRSWSAEGVERAESPDEALRLAGDRETFVVGGAEIYRQLLPKCTDLLLTRVLSPVSGETKLEIDLSQFEIIEQTSFPATERDDWVYFVILSRSVGGPPSVWLRLCPLCHGPFTGVWLCPV
jgi:dihydrofolate reductase